MKVWKLTNKTESSFEFHWSFYTLSPQAILFKHKQFNLLLFYHNDTYSSIVLQFQYVQCTPTKLHTKCKTESYRLVVHKLLYIQLNRFLRILVLVFIPYYFLQTKWRAELWDSVYIHIALTSYKIIWKQQNIIFTLWSCVLTTIWRKL